MVNKGWSKLGHFTKVWHYCYKYKTDWPQYPMDDGKGEGWHSYFKSYCGGHDWWRRGKKFQDDFSKTLPKRARPCLRCLVILAREKGII